MQRRWSALALALALAGLVACRGTGDPVAETADSSVDHPSLESTGKPRLVFLGDSLTAGFGLGEEQAFPALVGASLEDEGRQVRVVNAGVSGDTSAGGLARLDWLLRQSPDVVFVCLGANDGLRGLSPEMTERNLREIVTRTRAAGAHAILAGMRLPPNYGPDYVSEFEAVFPRLARELDVPLVPFLLEGVAGRRSLNLADGIHPNAEGQERIAEHVLPVVLEVVDGL